MSEFLLEIYGEEIPSSAQLLAENQLRNLFKFFKKRKNKFWISRSFFYSRRITIIINGLKNQLTDSVKEIRGPSTSADDRAVEGFIKSQGLKNKKLLLKKSVNGKEYFFIKKNIKQKSLHQTFEEQIYIILASIKWKKIYEMVFI